MKNQKLVLAARYFLPVVLLFLSAGTFGQVQTAKYVSMTPLSKGYYEYLPQGYSNTGKKVPLMIFFHGSGEMGNGNPGQLPRVLKHGPPKLINQNAFPNSFSVNGKSFSFVILSPQFTDWPGDREVDDIINYAIAHYNVDTTRIYLTGLSMGGGAVWEYAGNDINHGKRIAAMVPIAGASWPAYYRCVNIAAANIAVWATHNSGDPTVPVFYTVDYVNTIDTVPQPPNPLALKTIFQSNSHDAWTQTYDVNFRPNGKNVYEWMLQYTTANSTLAVTGLNFNARKKDTRTAELNWVTYSETNNKGFIIERSRDGITFDSIGFVSSLSVGDKGANYNFVDQSPSGGKLFYRLEQVNLDNTYHFSTIKFVQLGDASYVNIYPNPVRDILNINTSFALTNAQLNIYNVKGQLIMKRSITGSGTSIVPVKKLSAGIYSAIISDGINDIKFRFLKN